MEHSANINHIKPEAVAEPRRRRFWCLLLPFFILALAIPPLIPRKPDGLDFIRKHGPVREVLKSLSFEVSHRGASGPITVWHREFTFKAIPLDLLIALETEQESRSIPVWRTSMLPDGSVATWDIEKGTVNVQLSQEPPWLVRQWHALMNRLAPPTEQSPIH